MHYSSQWSINCMWKLYHPNPFYFHKITIHSNHNSSLSHSYKPKIATRRRRECYATRSPKNGCNEGSKDDEKRKWKNSMEISAHSVRVRGLESWTNPPFGGRRSRTCTFFSFVYAPLFEGGTKLLPLIVPCFIWCLIQFLCFSWLKLREAIKFRSFGKLLEHHFTVMLNRLWRVWTGKEVPGEEFSERF